MKKFLSAILVIIICTSVFTGCNADVNCEMGKHDWERVENLNEYTAVEKCSLCAMSRNYTDSDSIEYTGDETGFNLIRYDWDGRGCSSKKIDACDLGNAVMDCLSKLQETGDVIPEVAQGTMSDYHYFDFPVERGTVWIECGSVGMFRLNSAMTEVYKVQTHFGEGKALQMTDTLKQLLVQAWYYHPNDYWSGTYENGTVSLRQKFKADSAVEWVSVESIQIENKIDSRNNKITLCILANESKKVDAWLESYQSSDNLGSGDSKEIALVKGERTTVEFTFCGFYNCSYSVSIGVDNTRIELQIKPEESN